MKRLVYASISLIFIPIVLFSSDPNSALLQQELGYVGSAYGDSSSYMSDEDIAEALEEPDVIEGETDEESEDDLLLDLSGSEAVSVESSTEDRNSLQSKRKEFITWRKSLTGQDKILFKKIMRRRKKKFPQMAKPTKEEGMKLLRRAQRKQAEKQQKDLMTSSIVWAK